MSPGRMSFLGIVSTLMVGGFSPALAGGLSAEQVEFFEKRIRPLLVTHCYSCHSREAKKVRGELLLDTRAGLRKGGASGPAIVLGKPDESLLIRAVRYVDKDLQMPPKEKLSSTEIADLVTWVKMGAPDPRDEKVASAGPKDMSEARKHWSLQPVKKPAIPSVKDASWAVTDIDRFILATLEAKGLRPAGLADRRTLIRRATFDLTGLPPTPGEIDAFLKDESADAFSKVVDRLLSSSAYGERWGRHWLDVVRYADTAGDNSDYPIPQMYRYRNWVIDAFNRDMSYDEFVRQQLAGDLMSSSQESLIATGYLANSRRHGSYEDKRYPWHLTIEDTIDNFGKAFLGTTLGCARCHDHKFDPFSAEDYYGLYGFFSSTRYPWPGIELDKVQRDLVPLAPREVVEKEQKARKEKIAELDTTVKRLEQEKASADAIKEAKKERDALSKAPLPFEYAYAVIDGPTEPNKRIGRIGNVCLQIKGDPDRLGKEVERRFPMVLGGQRLPSEVKGSGRLELARWLTDPGNPLTARVMVNRIWQHHFGRGIVATPNDLGAKGRPPSHPELLDYLAHTFVHGEPGASATGAAWSVKRMHRLIMLSRVYQLSSEDTGSQTVDPENAYLSHYPRHRLDAESIRDSILAISGDLDRTPGGPHPFPEMRVWDFTQHKPFKDVYASKRRSVYLMTQRIQRHPFLALFDGPDTNASTAGRSTSTTPLQALFLMNNPFVHEQAAKFAARLMTESANEDARIERAFLLAFARPPSVEEREQSRSYLLRAGEQMRREGIATDSVTVRTWESFARVLFMASEFVYVN